MLDFSFYLIANELKHYCEMCVSINCIIQI